MTYGRHGQLRLHRQLEHGQHRPIRDVARWAGVSHTTVSRVINSYPGVSEATRQRVLHAIKALDYRPSRAARDLARGRSRSVTVMTSDTTLYGRVTLRQGVINH